MGLPAAAATRNTPPLLMVLALATLITTQTVTDPWLGALPFLFTFIGGVFADALENGATASSSCC